METNWERFKRWWVGEGRTPTQSFCFILSVVVVVMVLVAVVAKLRGTPLGTFSGWLILAALLAGLAGLFRDKITDWIWFPRLELIYHHAPPYCDSPPMVGTQTTPLGPQIVSFDSHWFRMAVCNTGTARAEKVEVIATDIYGPGAFKYRYSMNLYWSHVPDNSVLEGLSPGIKRYCDIGKVVEPLPIRALLHTIEETNPPSTGIALFSVATTVRGTHRLHLLTPGDYTLFVVVVAANCPPVGYQINIHVDGQWVAAQEQFLPHCTIQFIRAEAPPYHE
jgi:hypothetical protein